MHILLRVHFFDLFVFHLQVDVVIPLLLNASLLLVLTTDYDVFYGFWVQKVITCPLKIEKRSILECLCSLLALLLCIIFNSVNFLIVVNSLTRLLVR